jgi:cytochrome c
MTKTFLLFIVLLACACSNQNDTSADKSTSDSTPKVTTEPAQPKPDAAADASASSEKALELIGSSDCLTCHTIEEKKVGPAYRDVANKYNADEQTITKLADKIIKGGSGVWGQIPMAAHPKISEADAKTMVTYILSLKKK